MNGYLLDTHALVQWANREGLSEALARVLDDACRGGTLAVSTVCFWEVALLVKRGRLELAGVGGWKDELLARSGLRLAEPSPDEMIASAFLPDHHRDPFDRLLVAQAQACGLVLVTKDALIRAYDVQTLWC